LSPSRPLMTLCRRLSLRHAKRGQKLLANACGSKRLPKGYGRRLHPKISASRSTPTTNRTNSIDFLSKVIRATIGSSLKCWQIRLSCDAPDEFSDLAHPRRKNSQSGSKGANQRKVTDPAISAFLGNTAMGVNLLGHSAAVLGTD